MNQFKWTPEVGDRITTSDGTEGIVMPDGSLRGYPHAKFCYYCERDRAIKQHLPDWHNVKPRGKTRKKVKALKSNFEWHQNLGAHLAKGVSAPVHLIADIELIEPVKTVFDLNEGAHCFVLNMNGSIGVHIWSERNENLTNFAIRGLVFLTRKEAEQADNQRIKDTLGAEL